MLGSGTAVICKMLHIGLIDLGDVNSSLQKLKSSKYMLCNHRPLLQ